MNERFTDRARNVMLLANEEARRYKQAYIGTEHILLGLVAEGDGGAAQVLNSLDVNLQSIRSEVEKIIQPGPEEIPSGKLPVTPRARRVVEYSIEEARNLCHYFVGTEHLLLGLLREQEAVAAQVLVSLGLNLENARRAVLELLGANVDLKGRSQALGRASQARPRRAKKKTPALDSYGLDLTEQARLGRLTPIIGRNAELERVLTILSCRTRRNPILVGEIGVGKSAVVSGLAQLAARTDGPGTLRGRRLIAFNLAQIAGSAEDPSQLRGTLHALVHELGGDSEVLLYLDDVHTLAGTGGLPGAHFLSSALKSSLARQDLQCLAIATPHDYETCIAGDTILARQFEAVFLRPTTPDETLEILRALRPSYEQHHRVEITEGALLAAVDLSERYLASRALPGQAIHLLDEAAALLQVRHGPRPPDLGKLDTEIEHFTREKETAVVEARFDEAARLRDRIDFLRRRLDGLEREWEDKAKQLVGHVERETVAEVVRMMTGDAIECGLAPGTDSV